MPKPKRSTPASAAGAVLLAAALLPVTPVPALNAASPTPADRAAYVRPDTIPFPAVNPFSEAKRKLGEKLFFEKAVSGAGDRSCASCHDPATGWSEPRPRAIGIDGQPLGRRTPPVTDLAWGERYFWDGRAATLEEQALGPIQNPAEMNQTLDGLVRALAGLPAYPALFAAAFPEDPRITAANAAKALATFERTVTAGPTPFDRWAAGDETAIGEDAKRGFALFTGKAGCASCHSGWDFTDQGFHDIGLPGDDPGRGRTLGLPALNNAFKTPGLREVGRRAPYMHDGSLPTLEAVLDHYARGIVQRFTLSPDLPRVDQSGPERADLLAFLRTLDSDRPAASLRPAVEPAPPPAPAASATVISQRGKRFSERRVGLNAGQSLTVLNDDGRDHNVRYLAPNGSEFNSGLQAPGESVLVPFPDAGSYFVYCGIHPRMKMSVEVR